MVIAGDFCQRKGLSELLELNSFLGILPHQHKLIVAGNHDLIIQTIGIGKTKALLNFGTYLQDEGTVINGIRFWGSPWQPRFFDWAFNLNRGHELANVWSKVPTETDVLITHGPPHSILDETLDGKNVGCEELLKALSRIKPKLHIFGHIHESYGRLRLGKTEFLNVSICDEYYRAINPVTVIDLQHEITQK